MRNLLITAVCLGVVVLTNGCKKTTPEPEPTAPEAPAVEPVQEVVEEVVEEVAEVVQEKTADAKMVPLPLELPKPMFVGTPQNLGGIENLEPDAKQPRPAFLVPEGVTLLSQNKPVTSSEMDPINGTLDMVVDGDKDAMEQSVVELGPFEQWVQVDLEDEQEIYAIVFWHYHMMARVYFDVVVQVSNDAEFVTGVTTLFNNDLDNSLGLGVGTDQHYIDKSEGKLVDGKGTKGRYVRLYSQGNNQNDYSHYIEVEVFGK